MRKTLLDKAIMKSARESAKMHYYMSDGLWTEQGPEWWMSAYVGYCIANRSKKWRVYLEATLSKVLNLSEVLEDKGVKLDTKQKSACAKRSDVVVWSKSGRSVLAVVELKKAWGEALIKKDVNKLVEQMRVVDQLRKHPKLRNRIPDIKSWYLLCYTSKGVKDIAELFREYERNLPIGLVDDKIGSFGDKGWKVGFGLFKVDADRV